MNLRLGAIAAACCTLLCAVAAQPGVRPVVASSGGLPVKLADTGLYADGKLRSIHPDNRTFVPQYPLWSDGLAKRRWVYLPPGTTIDARDQHAWEFPTGTKFWKEFTLAGRRIETRLLWKPSGSRWLAATYLWNGDGSDAVLAPEDGVLDAVEVAPGRWFTIPSRSDCLACHGSKPTSALGFTALQLSPDRDPNAVHSEQLPPQALTLTGLVEAGLLRGMRGDLLTNPPRIRTSTPTARAALGYLAANCGMCHNGSGEIAAMGPVLRARELVEDGDDVVRRLIDQRTRWQLPATADGETVLLSPGSPERSALVARMRSRSPSSQMPPLGSVVRDQEAIDLVTRWVATELRPPQ